MDQRCANEAADAGLSGSFKAYLQTDAGTAASRFDGTKAPWQRVDGVHMTSTAQELLSTFDADLGSVSLVPNDEGGVFRVTIDGEELFSRATAGRFPESAELKRLVRDRIAPDRDLGHVDDRSRT